MEYNSFYGGRRGASFTIAQRFDSIEAMTLAFSQGGNYKEVNYDEFVIIDTKNKNDKDNGKIYKRGYDYTGELGGAIYSGQIVGPAGLSPHVIIESVADIKNIPEEEDFEYRRGEGQYGLARTDLVPGKYTSNGTVQYNDAIQWAYCSVRDGNGLETTAYIGFKFPYPVIEYTSAAAAPYQNGVYADTSAATRIDDQTHPFYEKWRFTIPKGIKGDTYKNFRVIEANNSIQSYEGQADDIAQKRKVFVCDYYHYDSKENGEPVTIFLGDYNVIDDITIAADGTLTVDYSHDNNKVYSKLIKYIKDITINKDTGHLKVTYNTTDNSGNNTTYESDLTWVKDIIIEDDGTLRLDYTDIADKVYTKKVKWLNDVSLATDGTVTVDYNNGTNKILENKIKWLTETTLATDGTLTLKYNDNTQDVFSKKIKYISQISLTDAGVFTIKYNNGDANFTKNLKWPTKVELDVGTTEGSGTQKIKITYNNGTSELVGQPLNYIIKTAITSDYHLIVLHSDPAKRASFVSEGKNYNYEGRNDWQDLGAIKGPDGILVGLNIDSTSDTRLNEIPYAIQYLNTNYPNGLVGNNLDGKIATIGQPTEDKRMYAYNYSTNEWFYLGKLDSLNSAPQMIIGKETDETIRQKTAEAPVGSLWFIVE